MTVLHLAPTPAPAPFYDDRCSCLQVDVAAALTAAGWDPLQALGTGWRWFPASAVEPVEYFHPRAESLREGMLLYHPAILEWRFPADPEAAHGQILEALSSGLRPIVAVDNFHLPFRPAHQDVHAAHLVVVEDWDPATDGYRVLDPMPPAFHGPLPRAVLERARGSANPDRGTESFFAGAAPGLRWLRVATLGPQPALTWPWLSAALRANLDALLDPSGAAGPGALGTLLDDLPDRVAANGPQPLRDLYVEGWPAQAEAGLHAGLLARAARTLRRPCLAEAARAVELVAGGWTGVRVAAAHGADGPDPDPAAAARRVAVLGAELVDRWAAALRHIETALERR
jgi:hypothetical protein